MLRFFANLKVAQKLALGFGLVLLLMSGTLAADVLASRQQVNVVDQLVSRLYRARNTANAIVTLVYAANNARLMYALTENQAQAAAQLQVYTQDIQQIKSLVSQAKALSSSDAQRHVMDELYTVIFGNGGMAEDTQQVILLKQEGKLQAAYAEVTDDDPFVVSLRDAHSYIAIVEREIVQQTARGDQLEAFILALSLSLGALALCLAIGIAVLIIRSITRPLAQVQRAAQQLCRIDVANLAKGLTALSQGDLTVVAQASSAPPLYTSRDEIGQTAQAMRSIIADVQQTVHGYELARLELQQLYGRLEEQNRILRHLSTTDPLTGLPNHRAVMGRLEEEISRGQRTQQSCAVLFVDLDHFKRINDTYGHQAGDAVLQEVGRRLTSLVRREDCVGRYGGEEFAIVLTDTGPQEAQQAAERLRAALADASVIWQEDEAQAEVAISVSGSIGVAIYPEHGRTRESLIESADTAMYYAKHSGRNRVCLADEAIAVVEELLAKARDGQLPEEVALKTLTTVADVPDRETTEHARRMVQLAEDTARQLGRPEEELHLMRLAALLHDIGKIGVSDAILHKPGPLTEEEWAVMYRHPEIGRQILVQAGGIFVLLSRIVVAHHERWDGGGYPYGLAQEAIPLGARILAVVDAFDAMTTLRPYRDALSPAEARAELTRCAGSQFDPQVVAAFLNALDELEARGAATQLKEPQWAQWDALPMAGATPQP